MKTIREGDNGFICMVIGTDGMCNDANSMEFIHALMKKEPPPDKIGISYMLEGETSEKASDARLDREEDRHVPSFSNYLGMGCVFYEDVDRG